MIKTKPLKHQISVVNKIRYRDYFALFMEYGTGKSYCVLAWIDINKNKLKNGVLIVGKKTNIMEGGAWPTEIETHTDFHYCILNNLTRNSKINLLNFGPRNSIYLINYDSVPSMFKEIIARKFDAIIFDESTEIKNVTAIRTKRCMKIAETIKYRAILTGFPVSESLDEIWSQFYMVDLGEVLKDNYWRFKYTYFHRWKFGWTINKGKDEEIVKKISDKSIFLKLRDCMDLPPRMYRYIPLKPTKEQIKYMEELKNDFSLTLDKDTKLEYKYILPVISKLQQICSGFLYLKNISNVQYTKNFNTPKDDIILDLVEEIPYKKIIWCKHTEEVEHLVDLLKKKEPYISKICSNDSDEIRQKYLYNFKNNKNAKTLVTTYGLLESGETLAMCNYNIHYSYTWSNSVTTNAKARTYRKGTEIHDKVVYIHLYMKDTIEETIMDALKRKKNLQNQLKKYMEKWLWD